MEPKNCPACGHKAEATLSGHYCSGWRAYVECPDYHCALSGPAAHDNGPSNNEYEIQAKAIEMWNSISLGDQQ